MSSPNEPQHQPPGAPGGYEPPHGVAPPNPADSPNYGIIMLVCTVSLAFLVVVATLGGMWYWDSVPGSAEKYDIPPRFQGSWSGKLTQYAPDRTAVGTWELTITLRDDSVTAKESSSAFGYDNCVWEVHRPEPVDDGSLAFSYTVTKDPDDKCAPTGDVLLERSSDALAIRVTSAVEGEETVSRGVLDPV
ncbi:hypothetical protein FHX37_3920 [Haloactinospora alba]|uniref:Uncharacterized protein n=1 Tax=Haloactinospora alba TaxID=405555 RepID=A0A543N9Q0_9ACTN|nr:hypothetical protein [Haloactinospora alba]TQN28572.1 hypothetical protein FHX37_3920 [Haloactinospora alba]